MVTFLKLWVTSTLRRALSKQNGLYVRMFEILKVCVDVYVLFVVFVYKWFVFVLIFIFYIMMIVIMYN